MSYVSSAEEAPREYPHYRHRALKLVAVSAVFWGVFAGAVILIGWAVS